MWNETPFTHKGHHYEVDRSELLLKPAAPIEIFTASRSERGLDMVARIADWWFVDFDKSARTPGEVLASLKEVVADMTRRAARFGRRVRFAFNPFIAFGASADAALREAEAMLSAAASDADRAMMTSYIGPAMRTGCIGRPADVRKQIEAYRDAGIELLLFKFPPRVEIVNAIRDEVIAPLRCR